MRNEPKASPVNKEMVAIMAPAQTQTKAAFEKHVLPELDVLYRTAWSLTRSDAEAQDLVQDTLLRAFRACLLYTSPSPRDS